MCTEHTTGQSEKPPAAGSSRAGCARPKSARLTATNRVEGSRSLVLKTRSVKRALLSAWAIRTQVARKVGLAALVVAGATTLVACGGGEATHKDSTPRATGPQVVRGSGAQTNKEPKPETRRPDRSGSRNSGLQRRSATRLAKQLCAAFRRRQELEGSERRAACARLQRAARSGDFRPFLDAVRAMASGSIPPGAQPRPRAQRQLPAPHRGLPPALRSRRTVR